MIQTEEDFETALEEATVLFDKHPKDGTADYRRLMDLLSQIAAWRPKVITHAGDPTAAARAHLALALKHFETQIPRRYSDHWHTLVSEI